MRSRTGVPPRVFCYEMISVIAAKALALAGLYLLFFASKPALPDIARRLFDAGVPR